MKSRREHVENTGARTARRARLVRYALATTAFSLATVAARRLADRVTIRHSLRGRVVVITGASTGIGRAVALECAARGAKVVLAARHEAELEATAREARSLGAEALAVPTDVADRQQVRNLVNAAVAHYGRIDVMMNHAGEWFIDSVEHSEERRVRRLLDVNVMGVVHGVQAVIPVMRRQGGGHIINTASVEGRVAFPFTGAYGGSKAFVEVLTQALRQELMHVEHTGIQVSVLLPPTVRTPFFDEVPNVKAGGTGAHMMRPKIEATRAARAVVDAMESYRPVIYPLGFMQGLVVLYDLLPGLGDRLASLIRADQHVNPSTDPRRGSHADEKPIPPVVHQGTLRD